MENDPLPGTNTDAHNRPREARAHSACDKNTLREHLDGARVEYSKEDRAENRLSHRVECREGTEQHANVLARVLGYLRLDVPVARVAQDGRVDCGGRACAHGRQRRGEHEEWFRVRGEDEDEKV